MKDAIGVSDRRRFFQVGSARSFGSARVSGRLGAEFRVGAEFSSDEVAVDDVVVDCVDRADETYCGQ